MNNKVHTVRIFHTNDLHSNTTVMPKIARFFKQQRLASIQNGEETIFIDVGDHMDRMDRGTEVSRGHMNREVLEASGYQYITLGNNEGITLTKEELSDLYMDSSLEVIVSNLSDLDETYIPWLKRYKIIALKGGYKIGLIGLTVPYEDYYSLLGWRINQVEDALPKLIEELSQKVDTIILLSHLGFFYDQKIAEKYPEIQIILGAHTHHLLAEGIKINQTLITQMGHRGFYVGEVIISYHEEQKSIMVESKSHLIDSEEEDQEIKHLLDDYSRTANFVLKEPVIKLKETLPVSWQAESQFGNLLAQGIRNWTGADISFVNSGSLLHSIPAGSVTIGDLLDVCPHPINPCVITVTGDILKRVLEEALLRQKIEQPIKGFGFRGKVLGFPAVDGCEVIYHHKGNDCIEVDEINIDGEKMGWSDMIHVGTIDMYFTINDDELYFFQYYHYWMLKRKRLFSSSFFIFVIRLPNAAFHIMLD